MDPPPPPVRSKRRKPPRKTLSSGNVIRGFVPSSRERRGVPPVPPRSGRARALESRRSMDEMMEAAAGALAMPVGVMACRTTPEWREGIGLSDAVPRQGERILLPGSTASDRTCTA